MALLRSSLADKNIVDRTKAPRNREVAHAVRRTRDRLSQTQGNPVFDRELLKLHARAIINSAAAIPVLVILIGAAGLFVGMGTDIVLWALITLACYGGLAVLAQRVARTAAADIDAAAMRRNFLIAHFVSGLGWTYFASLGCEACQVDQFTVVKAVVMLLVTILCVLLAPETSKIDLHAAPVTQPTGTQ